MVSCIQGCIYSLKKSTPPLTLVFVSRSEVWFFRILATPGIIGTPCIHIYPCPSTPSTPGTPGIHIYTCAGTPSTPGTSGIHIHPCPGTPSTPGTPGIHIYPCPGTLILPVLSTISSYYSCTPITTITPGTPKYSHKSCHSFYKYLYILFTILFLFCRINWFYVIGTVKSLFLVLRPSLFLLHSQIGTGRILIG